MRRGCASDLTDDKQKCNLLDKKCGLCRSNDLDGCNNQPIRKNAELSCINCVGAYNESCAWGHQKKNSKLCQKVVVFPDKESCYINVDRIDQLITRGCTLDKADNVCTGENNSPQYCQKCSEHGCNNQNVITQSCLVCHSGFVGEESCGSKFPDPNDFSAVCDSRPNYEYDERGCYIMKKSMKFSLIYLSYINIFDVFSGDLIVRGCAIDLSEDERMQCSDPNYQSCSLCYDGDNCNGYGEANVMKIFSGIVLIIFSSLLKVL